MQIRRKRLTGAGIGVVVFLFSSFVQVPSLSPVSLSFSQEPTPGPQSAPTQAVAPQTAGTQSAGSQTSGPQTPGLSSAGEKNSSDQEIESLKSIHEALQSLEKELRNVQRSISTPEGKGREEELTRKVQQLVSERDRLRRDFSEIAAGVELPDQNPSSVDSKMDLSEEVQELLAPLVRVVKDLTSRPRELDRMQRKIRSLSERLEETKRALENIASINVSNDEAGIQKMLANLESNWQKQKLSIETEIRITEQKLEKETASGSSLSDSVQEIFNLFFRSRGKNLILAIFIALVFWLSTRKIYLKLQQTPTFIGNRFSFRARVIKIIFLGLSGVGSGLVFVGVLFAVGDWLLLTLGILVLFAVVWSSKYAIERFWAQAVLLLNMGSVREGERVLYQDILWEVGPLNYYTEFRNPRMDHKHIRLPLRDLIELRSRPAEANEPWFPTQTGDWVVLDGSKLLRVVSQSAQSVVLVEKGGARRTYTTPAFLELAPRSISGGFRILVTFGVDYSHQPQVTGEILETLKQKIVSGMSARGCDAESFKAMVEFKEASASSLDIAVIVDFKGEHAESYDQLYRFLNSLCVDCCNENHWIIPFQQLTVHTHQNNFPAPLTPISEDLPSHP